MVTKYDQVDITIDTGIASLTAPDIGKQWVITPQDDVSVLMQT